MLIYRDFNKKSEDYNKSFIIDDSTEFDEWYNGVFNDNEMIFRGINNASFRIYTSAQRYWLDEISTQRVFKNDQDAFDGMNDFFLKYCRKWQNGLIEKLWKSLTNKKLPDLVLFAIMRHYGFPTPVVDFTKSINHCLYFAFDDISGTFTANSKDLNDYVSVYYLKPSENSNSLVQLADIYRDDQCLSYEWMKNEKALIEVDCNEKTELEKILFSTPRIINQKGLLLFNNNSFKYLAGWNTHPVREFHIKNPQGVRETVLFPLNIERPNFEQLSKDIGVEIPCVETVYCANINKCLREYVLSKTNLAKDDVYPSFGNSVSVMKNLFKQSLLDGTVTL